MAARLVFLLLWPIGLMGQETGQVTLYTTTGVEMRPLNAPAVVDVGPPIQVEVASAVTGTGQGTRLTDVQVVVSEGVGGTQAAGLAHEKVGTKGLLIGPDGNLWVSSVGGLSRFDGEGWTTFSRQDGLGSDGGDMEVDQQGDLWVAGGGGITRFDGNNWYHYQIVGGATDVAVGPDGDVWFAGDHRIYRFDGQDWWRYDNEDGIPGGQVSNIAVDRSGTLWADLFPVPISDFQDTPPPRPYPLTSFDGSQWTSYQLDPDSRRPDTSYIESIFVDSKNRVWVGDHRDLFVQEHGIWRMYDQAEFAAVRFMYEDRYGRLWTCGEGFGMLNGTSLIVFPYHEFRAQKVVMDGEGNLWIGSGYDGVIKWESSTVPTSIEGEINREEPESLNLFQNHPNPFNTVTEIAFDPPRTERLTLEVLNSTGQSLGTLMEGVHQAGRYQIPWDGRDGEGVSAASGVLFYRLKTETSHLTGKMVLVK